MIPREGDFDQANEVIQTISKGLGSDVDGKKSIIIIYLLTANIFFKYAIYVSHPLYYAP